MKKLLVVGLLCSVSSWALGQQILPPPYSGGGGGASLTGNNTFTGTNTFNANTQLNGGLNNWSVAFQVQDPANWDTSIINAGTGYAIGDSITLNDGCSTHSTLNVAAVTSGAITSYFINLRGNCANVPSGNVSQLSTSGSGTGAIFSLPWAPATGLFNYSVVGAGYTGNLFIGQFPLSTLGGGENTFVGGQAGLAFKGSSSFNTAFGLDSCGAGGFQVGSIGSSNTCIGTDAGRDLASTGTFTGVDAFGTNALYHLGSVSIGSFGSITALGNNALGNLTTVGGSGMLAVGPYAGFGATGLTVGNSTLIGPFVGQNATFMSNVTILGSSIGQTALNDADVLLIGTGTTPVEPPTTTTNDYMNINNMITATGINAPATGAMTLAAGTTTFAGNVAATAHNPTLSGCGTGPTISTNASSLHGTITEGTTATGCTITWSTGYTFASAPDCVVTSPTGNALTSYTAATGSLTLVNASATGDKFTYICMQ